MINSNTLLKARVVAIALFALCVLDLAFADPLQDCTDRWRYDSRSCDFLLGLAAMNDYREDLLQDAISCNRRVAREYSQCRLLADWGLSTLDYGEDCSTSGRNQ